MDGEASKNILKQLSMIITIHYQYHTHTRTHIHPYTYTPIHIHTHIHIHAYIHANTHTHTHIHTHAHAHTGRGAVFTADSTHEMEASIMNGETLKVRTVSLTHIFTFLVVKMLKTKTK